MKVIKIIVTVLGFLIAASPAGARDFNDKLMNRPYADLRRWHLGFSIGAHAEDIRFVHNGLSPSKAKSGASTSRTISRAFASTV